MNGHDQFSSTVSQVLPPPQKRIWINFLLFLLTVGTTMMIGANFRGYPWEALFDDPGLMWHGWPYSFALLLILTAHEMGHYLTARFHGMSVTLPYYIPLPIPGLFHFGTMGAFIKIKSPIPNRRALMDVAVGGPLAGLVFCLLFLTYGYLTIPDVQEIQIYVEAVHLRLGFTPEDLKNLQDGPTLTLGKSLLFVFFNDVLGQGRLPMSEVYHFPFIFAGWVGLLVTAINLIPIGQLDGGHIIYALFNRRAKLMSRLAFAGMGVLTAFLYLKYGPVGTVWIPWMIILSLIGLRHPPTMNDSLGLQPRQRYLGWTCIGAFFLCFMPLPIYI